MIIRFTCALAALFVVSCTTHIAPYRAKKRRFSAGDYAKPLPSSQNSLYASGGRGFFEDNVATRVGDVLIVLINEQESATRQGTTTLDKTNANTSGVSNALGLMAALQSKFPSLNPASLFNANSTKAFEGSGQIQRRGTLTATLPVRVRRIMPNGDFYVEGTKVVMVGQEEHHLYVSGVVRRADVSADNTVLSARIADAEIEYTGRGDVSDQQREGWFSRVMNKVWPF